MTSSLFRGSKHALLYSKFRPSPPVEFIDSIFKNVKSKFDNNLKLAVDIGCGSGQSTIALAPYFRKVIGYDISEPQINCAKTERSACNVEYSVSDCEKLPLPDSSVQLVTSSQAVHWFDTSKLFDEVKRILIPDGIMAIYGYWIPFPKIENSEKNKMLMSLIDEELHEKQLGEYWNNERYIVKNCYRDLAFPFKNIQRMDLTKRTESTLADYIGYLSTWSAYQKLYNEDGEKAEALLKNIEREYGDGWRYTLPCLWTWYLHAYIFFVYSADNNFMALRRFLSSLILKILDTNKTPEKITFSLHTDFFMLMGNT